MSPPTPPPTPPSPPRLYRPFDFGSPRKTLCLILLLFSCSFFSFAQSNEYTIKILLVMKPELQCLPYLISPNHPPPPKFFRSKANITLFDIAIRLTRVAFFFRLVFAEEQTRHASKCCVTSVTLPMVRRGTWVILAP